MNQTPATRRLLRDREKIEKDDVKKLAGNMEKDTPSTPSSVKIRTRLSTGTLIMNGTSTLKEKIVRTPPPVQVTDKTQKDAGGIKRRASSSAAASDSQPSVPPKQRKTVSGDGQGEGSKNDQWCWICHKEGCTIDCQLCPRSYHLKCLMLSSVPKEWVCVECQKIMRAECVDTRSRAMAQITTDTLCLLLRYALDRMRQPGSEAFQKPVDSTDIPLYSDYVIYPMDFTTLEQNIKKKEYGCTDAFLADAKWILHNCVVFNGLHHKLTAAARNIVKSCKHEMSEIEACPQCYQHSCLKSNTNWFLEPCDPPHTLVWAKLKGYPFWPAKALQEVNGQVDVRFFGAHDMSWIPLSQVFLLSKETPTTMRSKKGGFATAFSEMEKHIFNIRKKYGSFDYAPYRTPYDRRHVYMNNKLKGVNMMAAKRFKTGTHGKFVIRGKDSDKVSAAYKTASALKSKYSTMTNKKTVTVTGQSQSQRAHPPSSNSNHLPEDADKLAQDVVSSQSKTASSRLVLDSSMSLIIDDIQEKILKRKELEEKEEINGGDCDNETEIATEVNKDAGKKAEAVDTSRKPVAESRKNSDNSIKEVRKKKEMQTEKGKRVAGKIIDDVGDSSEKTSEAGSAEVFTESESDSDEDSCSKTTIQETLKSSKQTDVVIEKITETLTKNAADNITGNVACREGTLTQALSEEQTVFIEEAVTKTVKSTLSSNSNTGDTRSADVQSESLKNAEIISQPHTALKSSDGPESVARETSHISDSQYHASLIKTIEACKDKLGITDVKELEETMNISESEDNVNEEKREENDPKACLEISNDLTFEIDKEKIGSVESKIDPESSVNEKQDKVNLPKESFPCPDKASDSLQQTPCNTTTDTESVIKSVVSSTVVSSASEKNSSLAESRVVSMNNTAVTVLPLTTSQGDTVAAYTSIKPVKTGVNIISTSAKELSDSSKTDSNRVDCVSTSAKALVKSGGSEELSNKVSEKNSIRKLIPVTVKDLESAPSTITVNTETSKPNSSALTAKLISTPSNQHAGVKHITVVSSSKSNSTSEMKPITIDDDDEPSLLMEVESEAEHDALIIDLEEDDLELSENGSSTSQNSHSTSFERELAPSAAVMRSIQKVHDSSILKNKLTEPAKGTDSSPLQVTSSLSKVTSSSTQTATATTLTSSAPCVMIDVRSLRGTDHDWRVEENAQTSGTQSLLSSKPQSNSAKQPPPQQFRKPLAPSAEQTQRVSSSPSSQRTGVANDNSERTSEDEQGLNAASVNLVNKFSQQIIGNVQFQLSEMCKELLSSACNERDIERRLQEQKDQLQWTHEQQVSEIQHNFKMTIAEMKACWEAEKSKTLSDLKKKLTKEKEEAIAETKKKQWCAHCWKEALYYCCWNTSYCSYACQKNHWSLHQLQCRQSVESVNSVTDSTTIDTAATTIVTLKSTDSDVVAMSGKTAMNSGDKLQEDIWKNRLPVPPQTLGQNIHFLPAQQQQQPPQSAQPLQQLQYLHSLGSVAPGTFPANSQMQLLTQRPPLNSMLSSGTVMPGNTMVFPVLRTSQPGSVQGTQNVVINRPMHYQPMWKTC